MCDHCFLWLDTYFLVAYDNVCTLEWTPNSIESPMNIEYQPNMKLENDNLHDLQIITAQVLIYPQLRYVGLMWSFFLIRATYFNGLNMEVKSQVSSLEKPLKNGRLS
jgi:hypothetical protein